MSSRSRRQSAAARRRRNVPSAITARPSGFPTLKIIGRSVTKPRTAGFNKCAKSSMLPPPRNETHCTLLPAVPVGSRPGAKRRQNRRRDLSCRRRCTGPRALRYFGCQRPKRCRSASHVCLTTIRNNWLRWRQTGSPGDFIDFLADHYCPPSADPVGNANWKRNVKFFTR